MSCPLCLGNDISRVCRDARREFLRCGTCALTFVPPEYHLSPGDARQRYDLHRNTPDDKGYRAFLTQLTSRLVPKLQPGSSGLDFGSGPGPTLSVLMEEAGFKMCNYDIFYANRPELLAVRYDFVTCSETVEHFENPRRDFAQLLGLVREGGWVGIMTELVKAGTDFSSWRYANDSTHLAFYAPETFEWIGREFAVEIHIESFNVVTVRKPLQK